MTAPRMAVISFLGNQKRYRFVRWGYCTINIKIIIRGTSCKKEGEIMYHVKNLIELVKFAIVYLRKSRQDLKRETKFGIDTLDEQRKLLKNEVSRYSFDYDWQEEVVSGETIEGRPKFSSIINRIKSGEKIDAFVVKEITRLGRGSYTDMGVVYDLIQNYNILIITPSKIFDPKNEDDLRQIRFEMFLAREEFETTRRRLVSARITLAKEGKWMVGGSVPYGYEFDPATQKLKIDPEKAEVVKQVFEWYTEEKELGIQSICRRLKEQGILTPTGKQNWATVVVKKILSNEVYIGTVKFRTTERMKNTASKRDKNNKLVRKKRSEINERNRVVKERPEGEQIIVHNAHKPIVSKDVFNKAQEKAKNQRRAHPLRTDFSPGILAGVVTCPHCKKKMLKNTSSRKYEKVDGTISEYKSEFLSCKDCKVFAKYDDVINRILQFFKTLSVDDSLLKQQYDLVIERKKKLEQKDRDFNPVEQLTLEIENFKKLRLGLVDKHQKGIYDDDVYLLKDKEYKERIAQVEIEIEKAKKEVKKKEKPKIKVKGIKKNIKTVLDVFNQLETKEKKNELLLNLVDYCELDIIEKGVGRKPAKLRLGIQPSINVFID